MGENPMNRCRVLYNSGKVIAADGRLSDLSSQERNTDVSTMPKGSYNLMHSTQDAGRNATPIKLEECKLKVEKGKAKWARQSLGKHTLMEDSCINKSKSQMNPPINTASKNMNKLNPYAEKIEYEELDLNSAFFAGAVKRAGHKFAIKKQLNLIDNEEYVETLVQSAINLRDNKDYEGALEKLNEAIKLFPKRVDLYLKRGICFLKLAKFERSIQDAREVLRLSPYNACAFYNIAATYYSWNKLPEAEHACNVLRTLNYYTEEANEYLFHIRIKQLENLGFHPDVAHAALVKSKNKTVDEALEYIGAIMKQGKARDDIYYSDDEESNYKSDKPHVEENQNEAGACGLPAGYFPKLEPIVINKNSPFLTDSNNPLHCCSLFIGNLKRGLTYNEVYRLFNRFGKVMSIKLVSEQTCFGFVNFETWESAGRAMKVLQGCQWLLSTYPLTVRYPTKLIETLLSLKKLDH